MYAYHEWPIRSTRNPLKTPGNLFVVLAKQGARQCRAHAGKREQAAGRLATARTTAFHGVHVHNGVVVHSPSFHTYLHPCLTPCFTDYVEKALKMKYPPHTPADIAAKISVETLERMLLADGNSMGMWENL